MVYKLYHGPHYQQDTYTKTLKTYYGCPLYTNTPYTTLEVQGTKIIGPSHLVHSPQTNDVTSHHFFIFLVIS